MTKTKGNPKSSAAEVETPPAPSLDSVREIADALCRTASDCWHHHQRRAQVGAKASVETEARGLERLCSVCDDTLEQLAAAYERAAAAVRPDGANREWWHRANTLWLASREYARRHRSCDAQTRRLSGHHSHDDLESLHMEFELEASALLALRQASDEYCRTRAGVL